MPLVAWAAERVRVLERRMHFVDAARLETEAKQERAKPLQILNLEFRVKLFAEKAEQVHQSHEEMQTPPALLFVEESRL